MKEMDVNSYRQMFYPQTLAVIGASDSILKFGGMTMRTLKYFGYKGKLYPINPHAEQIQGIKAWPSLDAVPGPVDFAIIAIPAAQVMDAVRACIKKGVKGAEIFASGYKEEGPEGEAKEKELVKVAREGGMRIIGPNCFGIYNPTVGITFMPAPDFSRQPGGVGFFSQSGGGACDAGYMARGRSVYFSLAVSYGNGADIEGAEMLRYFAADPETKIVGAYIEGVRDGKEFFQALKLCASKKPVVILKGGLSDEGYRGTLGHTGSMAGTKNAWSAALKSANAIPARDMRDLIECLMAFNCLDGFSGGRAGVLAGGGMRVVESLDSASEHGFTIPELDPDALAMIKKLLPAAGGRAGNPVDLANPVMSPVVINPMMEIFSKLGYIDFLVLYQMIFYMVNEARKIRPQGVNACDENKFKIEYHKDIAAMAEKIRAGTKKPLVAILPDIGGDPEHLEMEQGRMDARLYYTSHNIPCFDTTDQAFSVLRRVADYYKNKNRREPERK